jgi:sugar phosphate isomerase/epimerase
MISPHRRRFIRAVAASAGTLLCDAKWGGEASSLRAVPGRGPSSVFGGVQIGVMTYSFRDEPLDEALKNIVAIGFSSVELFSGHLDPYKATDEEIKTWKKRFAEAGVKIASCYTDFPEDASEAQIDRPFVWAQLLGVDVITTVVGKHLVPRIDKACQRYKMKLGVHNELWLNKQPDQIEGPEDFMQVLEMSSRWVSITLDIGHFYAAGYDPVKFIQINHGRIVSLHLKDRERDSNHTDRPFGHGTTPVIPVAQTLKELHFANPANIEWEVDGLDPVTGVADELAYLKKALS